MSYYPMPSSCQIPNLSALYESVFGARKNGRFVEVGAYDGYTWSNTWGLAEVGWEGVYYEPMPNLYRACVERHRKNAIHVFQLALGNAPGSAVLHPGYCPTMSEAFKALYGSKYDPKNDLTVRVEVLDCHLHQIGWRPDFEVLVVDVEGYEVEVLQGFELKRWRPRLAIIETHAQSTDPGLRSVSRGPQIDAYFKEGYVKLYEDTINTIYKRV